MLSEFQKRWVSALRSGKYEQGRGQLNQNDKRYCCLGVACELIANDSLVRKSDNNLSGDERLIYYDLDSVRPSKRSMNFIGINYDSIFVINNDVLELLSDYIYHEVGEVVTLMHLNDIGVPFPIIADVIELEPEGLFINE